MSYEKNPDIKELIGGNCRGSLNLKSSIIFSMIFFGEPLINFLLLSSILKHLLPTHISRCQYELKIIL